jgi:ABC-type uncharacterized transport system involved in gliding motility auxiliary subunit
MYGTKFTLKLKKLCVTSVGNAKFWNWGDSEIYFIFFIANVKVAPTWQVYTKAVSPLKGLSRKT